MDGRSDDAITLPATDGTTVTVHIPEQIRAALTRALLRAGATPPPITTALVPAIDREPGHAGKYKLVKLAHPAVQA